MYKRNKLYLQQKRIIRAHTEYKCKPTLAHTESINVDK